MASGSLNSDNGTTVAQTLEACDEAPTTWADRGEPLDEIPAGPSASDPCATWANSPQTIERINSESSDADTVDIPVPVSGSAQTIDASGGVHAPAQQMAVFPVAGRPPMVSAVAGDLQVDMIGRAVPPKDANLNDMTTGERNGNERTLPLAPLTTVIGGRRGPANYEMLGELGRGGMGIVYKARDRRLNRLVALKMIRATHADEIQLNRFKIEAESVAMLRHPNILQIFDIGESDGSPYVALELLEGGSLADRLKGTPLPPKQAAEWMVPMALAMDAAHQAGVVHRDLKCANILFTSDGTPKITDFGLAKRLEMDEGQTHTGQVMGTPSYMAPEQARGETKSAGPPADIYALGAMLYEMLTGRPPFKGISAMETVRQVLEQDPVSPSRVQFRVPRDLEIICMKCLQKEPRKRFATAKEMADDLNRYLRGEPIRARRTPPLERAVKWTKRHTTAAAVIAFVTVGAVSMIGTGVWYLNHKRTAELFAARSEATLKEETANDLIRARDAMSKNDMIKGHEVLTSRMNFLEGEKKQGLASLYKQTEQMLGEVELALAADQKRQAEQQAKDAVQDRYASFLAHRKEAIVRDTRFTGIMLPANLRLTRKAAEDALGIFARRGAGDTWELGDLPATLTSQQQAQVKDGCYELLLVLSEVVASQDNGQIDRALAILGSADRLRPNHSRAYYLKKAFLLAKSNDRAGEERELAAAQLAHPESAFDYFLIGQEKYKRHKYADAIRDFESALRLKPEHFWARCLQGICYIQTLQFAAAKSCLGACLETDPDFAWLYLLRGSGSGGFAARYLSQASENPARAAEFKKSAEFEFDEAEADLSQALERLKNTPDEDLTYVLLVNRGINRFQRMRLDEAAADYNEAIRSKKDPFVAHAELGRVFQEQGKSAEAIEQFSRAIAIEPDWAPLYRGRAKVRQERPDSTAADRAAALADLKMAIDKEQMAIDKEKGEIRVTALDHTNRARLFYFDERFVEALEETQLALKAAPDLVEARVFQIQVLLKLRRYNDVISACDAVVAMGKKSAVIYQLRGLAQSARDNYASAVRDFSRALEIRPLDARLLAQRGWAYLLFDSPKPAKVDFEAAIELDPADPDARNGRGMAHARLGDYRAATADASEAIRLGKAKALITYNAARIYAVAASAAASDPGENGRAARQMSSRYQDIAVHLIREAFEQESPAKRAAFWQDAIQPDPALKAIRRRLNYEELIASNKKPGS